MISVQIDFSTCRFFLNKKNCTVPYAGLADDGVGGGGDDDGKDDEERKDVYILYVPSLHRLCWKTKFEVWNRTRYTIRLFTAAHACYSNYAKKSPKTVIASGSLISDFINVSPLISFTSNHSDCQPSQSII